MTLIRAAGLAGMIVSASLVLAQAEPRAKIEDSLKHLKISDLLVYAERANGDAVGGRSEALRTPSGAALSTASKDPGASLVLRSGQFSVSIDGEDGGLAEMRWQGKRITGPSATSPPLDWKQDEAWVCATGLAKLKLTGVKHLGPRTAVAAISAGDWEVEIRYELDDRWPMLTRSARLAWHGSSPTKLKGIWLGTPPVPVSKDGYYFAPGVYPPQRYTADRFRPGAENSFSHCMAPVVAQLSPAQSMLWISDEGTPFSDRTTATVSETSGGLGVTQGFEAMARMNPGDVQEIGSASLWLIEGDGETALRRIHDWMRRRGHVPPADRPDWLRDAAIYGFHPGGTFTSYCTDLGGFRPAMKLLDHIAALGVNTAWILPIQDVSSYSPRDYYAMQQGLGSADEFRALIGRAHQLGLHVLQDCVPHGGRSEYPRAKEHREWLAYKEDGSTLVYWCFDFNWPTWRDYMAGVVRHYVHDFGVDGFRVDAIEGSLIPNWNPEIPYGRASFARLQGGLNMLRSMRAAAKREKPDAGMLCETERSVYAAVGDAVYDFRLNYDALHDARRMPADAFTTRLRRYLHEQHYAQMPGLLRMRYCESHSTLSAELWYGIQPMRAIVALTAWIDGIPMIYHERESGHAELFRRIFAIRRGLPELRRGEADYLCVQSPPGVFACLRSDTHRASIVLMNFNSTPTSGEIRVPLECLPEGLRDRPALTALFPLGRHAVMAAAGRDHALCVPIGLEAFDFGVLSLRRPDSPRLDCAAMLPFQEPQLREAPSARTLVAPASPGALSISGQTQRVAQSANASAGSRLWEAWIDSDTGLLERLAMEGKEVLGAANLYLPENYRLTAGKAACHREGQAVVAERSFGPARLELRYEPTPSGLRLRSRWSPTAMPTQAALYVPIVDASRWWAAAAEGRVDDSYDVRHLATTGILTSFYWRPQGTNAIWDSLLQPLAPDGGVALGAWASSRVAMGFNGGIPARVRWLDRIGDRHELAALIAWSDTDAPAGATATALDMDFRLDEETDLPQTAATGLRPTVGGWIYENEHYLLRLSRAGMIVQLSSKGSEPRTIVDQSELYSDRGFGKEETVKFTDFGLDPNATRFVTATEVEAASRIWRDERGALRLRFEGRLRGDNRDLLKPPVAYSADYTLDRSPSFRVSVGVRPHGVPVGRRPFLAWKVRLPELRKISCSRDGKTWAMRMTKDGISRIDDLSPAAGPDRIELCDGHVPLAQLSGLSCGGTPIPGGLGGGRDFAIAFYDGPPGTGRPMQWSWATMVWTPGTARPTTIGTAPIVRPVETSLVEDPGFEQGLARVPVSLQTGQSLPGATLGQAWSMPSGGRLVHAPVHGGQAAMELHNTTGEYLLVRQRLQAARFPPGSRWRLSAWVKGRGITPGDGNWKKGVLLMGLTTAKWAGYSTKFVGSFDWQRVSIDVRIPDGLREVSIESGLNGATGKMWIDDVELSRLPE